MVPIPGSEILPYMCNSDNPGTKTEFPRFDIASHGVENQPHQRIVDWLVFVCKAGGLGEDRVLSPEKKFFHISTTPTTRGRKR